MGRDGTSNMVISMAEHRARRPRRPSDITPFDGPTIYLRGYCLDRDGPAGYWALILPNDGTYSSLVGSDSCLSKNGMSLKGAIAALKEYRDHAEECRELALEAGCEDWPPELLRIYSDSEYLVTGMKEIREWQARGWQCSSGSAPANLNLWMQLYTAAAGQKIEWVWIDEDYPESPHYRRASDLARMIGSEHLM
jgi:ribonuclease HI